MRFSFEKSMESYRDSVRERSSGNLSPEEEAEVQRDLSRAVERASRTRETSGKTQWAIVRLQEEKQEAMRRLHERLALLDRPHERSETEGPRLVRRSGEGYVAVGRNGAELPVTKGELFSDMAWGVSYDLDDSVERGLRKKYLVESAKAELRELLDRQITLDEAGSARNDEGIRNAFRKREQSTGFETGFLAERMVKGFLTKLSIDHDLGFTVEDMDAFDDVVRKMDFGIVMRSHERGVDVEESETAERVRSELRGVQFTTNVDPHVQRHKARQVRRVNESLQDEDPVKDVVLVTMPARDIREAHKDWLADPRPGGPDKLWDEETRKDVFAEVMKEMMPPEEIAAQWTKIEADSREDSVS